MKQAVLVISSVTVLLTVVFVSYAITGLSRQVWIPDVQKLSDSRSVTTQDVANEIISHTTFKRTSYGNAIVFSSANGWKTIYELGVSKKLDPSECPNVMKSEVNTPTECKKIGDIDGNPVYTKSWSFGSGAITYYTIRSDAFIALRQGGDGSSTIDVIKELKETSILSAIKEARNHEKQISKVEAAIARRDKADAQAYTKLNFTPVLPKQLPQGWEIQPYGSKQVFGSDNQRPRSSAVTYTKARTYKTITIYSTSAKDVRYADTACPVPPQYMRTVNCFSKYEAYPTAFETKRNTTVQYMYRTVGDTLVTSMLTFSTDEAYAIGAANDYYTAQKQMMDSADITNENTFKGSEFVPVVYEAESGMLQ